MFHARTVVLALALPSAAMAVPSTITTQGRLLDSVGEPIEGSHDLSFAIYDDPTSTDPALWSETRSVPLANGYYQVALGEETPLTTALFQTDGSLYLGITVGNGEELSPRQPLMATAYAHHSDTAVNLDGGSVSATAVSTDALDVGAASVTDTKISTWDATASAWGTGGITIGSEVELYVANGDSGVTNLGASDGRRLCFLARVQFHDTFRNESLGDCHVRVSSGNWQLFANADNGDGDPDIRCRARCMSW